MVPSLESILAITLHLAAILALSALYFLKVRMQRPPVGVYNLKDIFIMMLFVVVLPPLYLQLPAFVVAIILGLVFLVVVQFTLAPFLPGFLVLLVALALVGADVATAQQQSQGGLHPAFVAVNNLLVGIAVVGVCSLYTQSGMRARDVAVFAAALAVYDFVATAALPVMVEFFTRLVALPFVPVLWWGDTQTGAAVGLGDIIVMTLWTLVAWKGFGRTAAWVAALSGLGSILAILLALWARVLTSAVPAMVVLGPLIVLQYLIWKRRWGRERTVAEYERAEMPQAHAGEKSVATSPLQASLRWLAQHKAELQERYAGQYVALWGEEILGAGQFEGDARRAARQARPDVVPYVVYVAPELSLV